MGSYTPKCEEPFYVLGTGRTDGWLSMRPHEGEGA